MPILLASQSIPVFALAPILILWFGYGISSKIIIGVLIVFFPIASNFSDAINKTPKQHLDAGNTLGLSKNQVFWLIKIPLALPGLFSGIRVASCFAPIGAVVGEWIGGSIGLGSYMIYSNARLQIDNMFAALIIFLVHEAEPDPTAHRRKGIGVPLRAADNSGNQRVAAADNDPSV